jgi:hypothetical protein
MSCSSAFGRVPSAAAVGISIYARAFRHIRAPHLLWKWSFWIHANSMWVARYRPITDSSLPVTSTRVPACGNATPLATRFVRHVGRSRKRRPSVSRKSPTRCQLGENKQAWRLHASTSSSKLTAKLRYSLRARTENSARYERNRSSRYRRNMRLFQ